MENSNEPKVGHNLPNLDIEFANFKSELKKLSKNELVRQAAAFYVDLILSYNKINDMESQLKIQSDELTALKQSKESHD